MLKRCKSVVVGLALILVFSAQASTSQEYLFETATAYWRSQALFVVAKHKIADELASGPIAIEALSKSLHLKTEPLYRLLRTLAAEGIFQEHDGRRFSLTDRGFCLRSDVPCSMRNAVLMYGSEQFNAWANLDSALTESVPPFEKTFGTPVFKYLKSNAAAGSVFNGAMKELATQIYSQTEIIASYNFRKYNQIIDIGGGNGAFLREILTKADPNATGILFDLPEVLANVKDVGAKITPVEGDFFKSIPTGGDLYLLKRILHDWEDQKAVSILTQIRKGIRPDGRLIIVEWVIEQNQSTPPKSTLSHWLDLHMLVMTGGKERSDLEFSNLLAKSGFKLLQIIPVQGKLSILEAEPLR